MKNILFINSSPRGSESCSLRVGRSLVDELVSRHPDVKLVVRDLAEAPPPHVGRGFVSGISIPPEHQTPAQSQAIALSDALVDELSSADTVVIAAPMHNFSIPSTLKAWIDHVVRAGRTFRYTQTGPQGLLSAKRAILVLASGGVFSEGPGKGFDFQEPYLRAVLGFIGITDVQVVRAEGVLMGSIGPEKAMSAAMQKSREVLARFA